jgi:peptidoglycan/LPS O-acetylase OafA/YrhL
VVIGRSSHGEDPLGVLYTLWPFATGALVGWLASRAWRAPLALVPTGLVVWIGTVVVGVALRAATGDGAPLSFVIVTTLVLAAFLLGWRAVAAGIRRVARGRADRVRNTD